MSIHAVQPHCEHDYDATMPTPFAAARVEAPSLLSNLRRLVRKARTGY